MKKILSILFVLIGFISHGQKQNTYLITDFGAKPNGKTVNTVFIQEAIDRASLNGGGKVIIPAGYFVTGVIYLKNNVELNIIEGAVLLGSTDRFDYGKQKVEALITAKNQHHISITGSGEINGRGRELVKDIFIKLNNGLLEDDQWKLNHPSEKNRPSLINFIDCDSVTIKNITLKNAAGWVQNYLRCNHLVVDSITVNSTEYWNNDGIDIVNSKNVSITNSFIDAADDAICLKSEGLILDSCVNIYVANCKLRSSANAFKIGTGSVGGFRNIKVRDLTIYDTYRAAIALEAVDGGFIENVDIATVHAINTGCAIFIKLGHRNNSKKYSTIKHIKITNLTVKVPSYKPDIGYPVEGPLSNYPHNIFPSSITGIPGYPVTDVLLENITIDYDGGARKSIAQFCIDTLNRVPENRAAYPEFSMFGELPCWGMYLRHVKGVAMKNITFKMQEPDYRPAIIFDDINRLDVNVIKIVSPKLVPVIVLNKVKNYTVGELQLPVDGKQAIKIIP